ncbi:MAG: hypothetical protein J0L84_01980 [Verrucomicrobia bacterium]|nr:hypothetical protein [Verrucomicrobiota bacterium]
MRVLIRLAGLCGMVLTPLMAGEFRLAPPAPSLDRWVYPFGDFGGDRPVAPTFASFDPRFDTRDAQALFGWDTASQLATNSGPDRYLIRRVRIGLTIQADQKFVYDPSFDPFQTFLTNHPAAVPDSDPGRPVELYGAGYRNGFSDETWTETSPFGAVYPITSTNIALGTRNVFAAMHGEDGRLMDVSNNVGQYNAAWTHAPFEVRPWALGLTTNAGVGELVPAGARFVFEVDLADPQVAGYFQAALDSGRLRVVVSSLSPAIQITPGGIGGGGNGDYPQWVTRENLLFDGPDAPSLEMEGTLVGDDDTDQDGHPDDWERFWFRDLSPTRDSDSDQDGATDAEERVAGTDPSRAASRLQILAVGFDAGAARLRFTIAPSRRYRVEASPVLGGWSLVSGETRYPEPGVAEFVGSPGGQASGSDARFFRVVVEE